MTILLEIDELSIIAAEYALIKKILEDYPSITYKEMGDMLGCSERSAYRRTVDFGLSPLKKEVALKEETKTKKNGRSRSRL